MIDLSALPQGAASKEALRLGRALLAGGVKVLQVRMKHSGAAEMLTVLTEVLSLAEGDPDVMVVMNDRLDVGLCGGAHAVHLGQTDLPIAAARRICPKSMVLGVSTHSEEQAKVAIQQGADYIALGPIYGTTSKDNPDPSVGVEVLEAVCKSSPIPVVAIGGITLAKIPEIVAAGAHAAAMISAINQAPDIVAAAASVGACFG